MKPYNIDIRPFGDRAILLEWPNRVEETILEDILRFESQLKKHHLEPGEWEMVPAYNSLTLIYRRGEIDFNKHKRDLEQWYKTEEVPERLTHYLWKLPVCYDEDFGIDLAEVAKKLNKTTSEVIQLHTANSYTVYGIGFLPGFMYLGGLPAELETARRGQPRLSVSKGAVGLAGKQTGIYPQQSPGGWNIIGNCPIPIFNVENEDPCFVNVGDKISFYQITRGQYDLHKIEAEVGIYTIDKAIIDA